MARNRVVISGVDLQRKETARALREFDQHNILESVTAAKITPDVRPRPLKPVPEETYAPDSAFVVALRRAIASYGGLVDECVGWKQAAETLHALHVQHVKTVQAILDKGLDLQDGKTAQAAVSSARAVCEAALAEAGQHFSLLDPTADEGVDDIIQ